jgi:hypothetical protein
VWSLEAGRCLCGWQAERHGRHLLDGWLKLRWREPARLVERNVCFLTQALEGQKVIGRRAMQRRRAHERRLEGLREPLVREHDDGRIRGAAR